MKSPHQLQVLTNATIRRLLGSLALLPAALFTAVSVTAAPLASYNMENAPNRSLASFVAGNVTATSLTGNNLNAFGAVQKPTGNYYTTWVTTAGGGATAQDALTAAQYMHLTVTPVAGTSFTLSSISFDIFAATGGPSARQLYLFSDKTGFVDGSELLTASTVAGTPLIPYNTVATGQNFSIDLSGFGAMASVSDSVTFRFYFQTPNATQGIALDNITVSGTVVPEPSTFALLGLGLFSLLAYNRNRRQA
jgi:hypothetical protein